MKTGEQNGATDLKLTEAKKSVVLSMKCDGETGVIDKNYPLTWQTTDTLYQRNSSTAMVLLYLWMGNVYK